MSLDIQSNADDVPKPECQPEPHLAEETAIFSDWGKPRVLKCVTKDSDIFAKKVGYQDDLLDSEVRMMGYATGTCHVNGPKLRHAYLKGTTRTIVMDLDPGVPVNKVWKKLSRWNRKLIIRQLRAEILKMSESTQPSVDRIGHDGNIAKDDPSPDPYYPETPSKTIDFFAGESEFDAHKIEQLRRRDGRAAATNLENLIAPLRERCTERFVLTHLHQGNTHIRCVKNTKGNPF